MSTPDISRLAIHSPSPRLPSHPHRSSHSLRAASPTGSARSSYTSRRRVKRNSSHYSNGFLRSHRSEVSKELQAQAEGEFFALMELMSSMSRRSISLKEVWAKIISERESLCEEMDRMYERFDEFTEIIERKEKEHHSHNHDHEEHDKETTKLRLELSVAINSTSQYKKKLSERDTELGNCRREIAEFKDNYTYLKTEHEDSKRTLEETQLKLMTSEEARCQFEGDAKKHHSDLRSLNARYIELQVSHEDLTSKYESMHKEDKEKHEWLHEKGILEEESRKGKNRNDGLKRKNKELSESHEKKVREVYELEESVGKVTETVKKIRKEREELEMEEHCRWEDAEDRCGKWKLKWEHSEREIFSLREEIRILEISKTELHETMSRKLEEYRLLIIEKERLQEDHHHACARAEENHRQILITIKEKTEIVHTYTERIERLESERDEAHNKCRDLSIELSEHTTLMASLNLELSTLKEQCDILRAKCSEWEGKYEEGSSGFEVECQNLRTMLRDAREQREMAISAKSSADSERDQVNAKYEEKCRAIESLKEQLNTQTVTRYSSLKGSIHERDEEPSH
ncbi:hypothetical protein K504DRAFT_483540 [Pleomassaria siparia CBS 279.74]|uniref:Uncharacterized protein n=1 Tax=Pleomassaria siparia CBS 279.74 TaxID=1314801 RepID=A0A6G1K3S9_9PLEO|nr:hypothetical protein K504DRAFT_483540 [Pleomassaria siparia CBS 279.74]